MLTREQQEIIDNSIWVVNTVLKKHKLQRDNDLRQEAILCMCRALENFDENRGTKWTTYAYTNVSLFVLKEIKRKIKYEDKNKCISEALASTDDPTEAIDENLIKSEKLSNIKKKYFTELEWTIFKLYANDYTKAEMREKLHLSWGIIKTTLKSVKAKIIQISEEEEQ